MRIKEREGAKSRWILRADSRDRPCLSTSARGRSEVPGRVDDEAKEMFVAREAHAVSLRNETPGAAFPDNADPTVKFLS